ncbi:MAG TPA: serine protein kinase RIO [Candidatus Acidoferrales bacterium]|nr:serine protein kinase RIO [Candidatus Acidoferrales bacterium]
MTRRLAKRKRPDRDIHLLKGQNKVDSGIFDDKTMILLSKFYNKGIIEQLLFPVARGKEADVYIASAGASEDVKGKTYVIVKFFRIETSSFFKMEDYIVGDPRFKKIGRTKIAIVKTWCKKEFGNLSLARHAGANAPKPYMFNGSILAMEFIGAEDGTVSPQLKDMAVESPEIFLDNILQQVRLLYKSNLVHADLSEFNILVKDNQPYIIDFGQAVSIKHPNAMEFLERDIRVVLNYFGKKYEIKRDAKEVLEQIIK